MIPISLTVHQDAEYSNNGSVDWDEPPLSSSPTFYLGALLPTLLQVHWPFFLRSLPSNWGWEFSSLFVPSPSTLHYEHTSPLILKLHFPSFYLWPQPHLNLSVQPRSLAPSFLHLFFKGLPAVTRFLLSLLFNRLNNLPPYTSTCNSCALGS